MVVGMSIVTVEVVDKRCILEVELIGFGMWKKEVFRMIFWVLIWVNWKMKLFIKKGKIEGKIMLRFVWEGSKNYFWDI